MPGIEGPFVASGATDFALSIAGDVSAVVSHVDTLPTLANVVGNAAMDMYYQVGWYSLYSTDLSALGLEPVYYARRRYIENPDSVDWYVSMSFQYALGIRTFVAPGGQVTFYVAYR